MTQHRVTSRWLAIVLAVGVLLGVAGCGTSGSTSSNLPSSSSILAKVEQTPLKDVTFTVTTQQPYSEPNTGSGELTITPKRTMTITGTGPDDMIGRFTDGSNYYVVPSINYTNSTGQGTIKGCISSVIQNDPDVPLMLLQQDFLDYTQLQKVEVLGSEKMNGTPTWHLQSTHTVTGTLAKSFLVPETLKEDLWFRQDNAFPAKLVFAVTPSSGGLTYEVITLVFLKWNSGLTIPDPIASLDLTRSPVCALG